MYHDKNNLYETLLNFQIEERGENRIKKIIQWGDMEYKTETYNIENKSLKERIDLIGDYVPCSQYFYYANTQLNRYMLATIIEYYFPMEYRHRKGFHLLDQGNLVYQPNLTINKIITNILKKRMRLCIYREVLDRLKTFSLCFPE